ncbi:MgtC/SapB family protein [Roseiarcaceae bacterium H3SJ34-1]|uniref:MgtC/SapB family protein n=1 Tax=Terripilifer ovatus TaxID=3032367 RepID=UPI003AB99B55|nr:MgtC/SapB family protein [Roseiarcaceae bacterium H3SJ34-1]
MPFEYIVLQLFTAALCGGAIGLNRSMHGKPAGMRVHGLVALGSALLMMAATATDASGATRVAQGIVTGIGFLGAGIILHRLRESGPDQVFHLATATTVWLAAAIGIACGVGQWMMAIAGTLIGLLVLVVFIRIDSFFFGRFSNGDDNGDPLS